LNRYASFSIYSSRTLYSRSLCTQSFFGNMKYCDITLVCDEREFSCHKFMLAKKSDVFDAMFSHDFRETATGRVIIKDLVYVTHAIANINKYIGVRKIKANPIFFRISRPVEPCFTVYRKYGNFVICLRGSCYADKSGRDLTFWITRLFSLSGSIYPVNETALKYLLLCSTSKPFWKP